MSTFPECTGQGPEAAIAGGDSLCGQCAGPAGHLLDSYRKLGGINHLEGKNLPSRRAVAGIARDLVRLLFPGFFEERLVHADELPGEVGRLLYSICQRLQEEVARSLRCAPGQGVSAEEAPSLARTLTAEFLDLLPEVRELLKTDVEAAFQSDPASADRDEIILAYPFLEAIAVQRLAHRLYLREVPLVPRMMTEWAHGRTGLDLHPGAEIGSHFFVDHCTGTVVGETTRIGSHVKLYQGVGLVARSLSGGRGLRGTRRHPTLEDRVTVYSGATIMGGDTVVGAGSTIGANVFLTQSVPARSLVVHEKARIIIMPKDSSDADYQI